MGILTEPRARDEETDATLETAVLHTVSSSLLVPLRPGPYNISELSTLSLNYTRNHQLSDSRMLPVRTHGDQFGDKSDSLPWVVGHEGLVDVW